MTAADERLARMEELLAQTTRDTAYLRKVLVGTGDEKAITTRVDRLEQTQRRWGRWLWAVATVALAGAVDAFKRWISG